MAPSVKSNVVVRPGEPSDLEQVRQISAHYIVNTVINFAYHPPTPQSIKSTLEATKQRNLPYLVAIDDTTAPGQSAKLLGYTYAAPFPSTRLAYAHTLELSIFVHPDAVSRGVGSTLLRALLEYLRWNQHHAFEPGSETEGRQAYARKLIAKMSYDTNGPGRDASEALRRWYAKWGFTEVGTMKDVGFKFGRYIDTMDHILDLDRYYHSIGASVEHREDK